MKIPRRFHADVMQISRRVGCGIVAESIVAQSKRNTIRILAESTYALSMLDSMQHEDFTQISHIFNADFRQNGLRNGSGIVAQL